jgi:5-methyltetrahydropteroyltriglutamate--homocysteine methyltransferase
MIPHLLPTTVVGSYPQPDWLIDRAKLTGAAPPRIRMKEVWRIDEPWLEQAQDDATRLAVADMEAAGIDLVTDGEIRRESYSNRFATALAGIDLDNPGQVPARTSGRMTVVPRVVGPIKRIRPVQVRDVEIAKRAATRPLKITLPGPFTMAMQAVDDHYKDPEALAMDLAAAVNEEVRELFAAGADVVQLDEPWMESRPEQARAFAVKAINRALAGATGPTAVHLCFGYAYIVKDEKPKGYHFLPELDACVADQISMEAAQPGLQIEALHGLPHKQIVLGVVALDSPEPETPQLVAERIRAALQHVPAERLVLAPDCGMKYLSRESAFAKLKAMVDGAAIVRRELMGTDARASEHGTRPM